MIDPLVQPAPTPPGGRAGWVFEGPGDAELVSRAAGGGQRGREAMSMLYARYGGLVHGVLLARVGAVDADDLTQEVFVRAMKRIGSVRDAAAVGGWLAEIARNEAATLRRGKLKLVGGALDAQAPGPPASGTAARRILAEIRALPEAYQETMVLRLVEGMTGPQIAAALGMTHGSVRVNLTRGMKLLREKLNLEARP